MRVVALCAWCMMSILGVQRAYQACLLGLMTMEVDLGVMAANHPSIVGNPCLMTVVCWRNRCCKAAFGRSVDFDQPLVDHKPNVTTCTLLHTRHAVGERTAPTVCHRRCFVNTCVAHGSTVVGSSSHHAVAA